MTGMIVTAPGCAPLLIDTCGGLELARQLEVVGFDRADLRAVIVTHRHLDHAGGIEDLLLARMPLDIYALLDTQDGIAEMTHGSFPEWGLHPDVARHQISPGTTRDIAGFRVEFFRAEHRVPTVAVRVSKGAGPSPSAPTLWLARRSSRVPERDLFLCDTFCAELDGEEICEASARSHYAFDRERGCRNGNPRERRRSRLHSPRSLRQSRAISLLRRNTLCGRRHRGPGWRPLPPLS